MFLSFCFNPFFGVFSDANAATLEPKPIERQVEARPVDDSQGSMVRCVYLARTFIVSVQNTTPTMWAGTNNGTVYVFTLSIPQGTKRKDDGVHCQLGESYFVIFHSGLKAGTVKMLVFVTENMFLMYNRNLDFTKATHYIINYQKTGDKQLFRIEAYYKDYENLIKTVSLQNGAFSYNNKGSGYAEGIDVFWRDKKTFKNFEYWVSYSYLDTKRDYLNYSETLRPDYATPHTFSVVGKKFFQRLKTQVNLTYSFATGRPYYHFIPDGNHGYDLTDKGTTIDYNSIGLSLDYLPNLGKANAKNNIVIVATVSNLLNNKQIYGYNYSYTGSYKEAVLPPARQFFFIGIFFTWGVDRSQQVINDNL